MKKIQIALYGLAGAIFVTAVVLFFVYTIHDPMQIGEGGEVLGWILGASMIPLFALFVFRCIFLSKKTSPATKTKLAKVYGVSNKIHMPVASVTASLLFLHFAMVFNVHDPSWVHFITGYVMFGLLDLLVAMGLVAHFQKNPVARKSLTVVHQILVACLICAFVVHLILK
jgi:hypothetical protein